MTKGCSITTNYKIQLNQIDINQIQHMANNKLCKGDCISENEFAIAF